MDVWRVRLDPKSVKVLGFDRLTTGTGHSMPIALSPDSIRLAFTARMMRHRLWSFPFNAATAEITGRGVPVTEAESFAWESSLSRDGGRLAYRRSKPGSQKDELVTLSIDTGISQVLTTTDQDHWLFPVWSPDGRRIARLWSRETSKASEWGIVVSTLDGSDAQSITTPRSPVILGAQTDALLWDWSADGTRLFGTTTVGTHPPFESVLTIWSVAAAPRAEVGARVLAADKKYALFQSRLSPNGRWVGFVAARVDDLSHPFVYVVRADAEGAAEAVWTLIAQPEWITDKPRWSPDGRLLYFTRREGMFWNLWAVRFDDRSGKPAGAPFPVTHLNTPELQLSPLVERAEIGISQNRLVLTLMERTGSIWIEDNVDR
jgi:Tol biopolymer transport system component